MYGSTFGVTTSWNLCRQKISENPSIVGKVLANWTRGRSGLLKICQFPSLSGFLINIKIEIIKFKQELSVQNFNRTWESLLFQVWITRALQAISSILMTKKKKKKTVKVVDRSQLLLPPTGRGMRNSMSGCNSLNNSRVLGSGGLSRGRKSLRFGLYKGPSGIPIPR